MIQHVRILIIVFLFFLPGSLYGQAGQGSPTGAGEVKRGIQAEGACAIVGMSAEQSQLTALQRARAAAIEQAAGVSVSSSTLVTNYVVAADFIKTYARGFIVSEKATWLLGQYQKDSSTAPIPEYRVRITADVYVPKKKSISLGLKAKLNSAVFRNGEKAKISVKVGRDAGLALFNIMADDRVSLIFPNIHEQNNVITAGKDFLFPSRDAKIELEMRTLPDHQKDAEAFFVVAWDRSRAIRIMDMFPETEPLSLSEFFRRMMEIADNIEDAILPYEVTGQ